MRCRSASSPLNRSTSQPPLHFAYLYSRYPVLSQTFCDTEMLALERRGWSLRDRLRPSAAHQPCATSMRPGLQAPIYYAPPQEVLKISRAAREGKGDRWPVALVARHEQRYTALRLKAALRARNALYFAELFAQHGVAHFHVHFANRAAQTALFLKAISGIPFSITAHGQDFMVDLGSIELLREICSEAEFVAAETDYSTRAAPPTLPGCRGKNPPRLQRDGSREFSRASRRRRDGRRNLSRSSAWVGWFRSRDSHCLLDACAELLRRGCDFRCEIAGDGPLRESLAEQLARLQLQDRVVLSGARSQGEMFFAAAELRHFRPPLDRGCRPGRAMFFRLSFWRRWLPDGRWFPPRWRGFPSRLSTK